MLSKANPQHILRMTLFIRIMDDKVKKYGLKDVADLPQQAKDSAWEEAVAITKITATNQSTKRRPQ